LIKTAPRTLKNTVRIVLQTPIVGLTLVDLVG
jgi:hypothetical protein